MKFPKLAALAVASSLALGLTACGSNDTAPTDSSSSTQQTTAAETQKAAESKLPKDIVANRTLDAFMNAPDKPLPAKVYVYSDDIEPAADLDLAELPLPFTYKDLEAAGFRIQDPNASPDIFDKNPEAWVNPTYTFDEYAKELDENNARQTISYIRGEQELPGDIDDDEPLAAWRFAASSNVGATAFFPLAAPEDAAKQMNDDKLTAFAGRVDYFAEMMGRPDELYIYQKEAGPLIFQHIEALYREGDFIMNIDLRDTFDAKTLEPKYVNEISALWEVSVTTEKGLEKLRFDRIEPKTFEGAGMTKVF